MKGNVIQPTIHRTAHEGAVQYSHKGDLQHSPRRSNPTQPTQEHNEGGYKPGYLQANRPANKLGFGQCKTQSPQARRTEAFWEASQLIWPMHGEEPATLSLKFLPRSGSSPNVTYPCDCQQNHFGNVPYHSFCQLNHNVEGVISLLFNLDLHKVKHPNVNNLI